MLSRHLFDAAVRMDLLAMQEQERLELIRLFWPDTRLNYTAFDGFSSKAVMSYIVDQLTQVKNYSHDFAAQTFQDMSVVLATVKRTGPVPCENIVRNLESEFPTATSDMIRRSIELTIRIWLTTNIHSSDISVGPFHVGDSAIDWPPQISLEQLIQGNFSSQSQLSARSEISRFDPSTTLAYLVATCGLRVLWTDDISSHLMFDVKRLELNFYRHKACLINLYDVPSGCPISKDVIEEILDTMDLLLPPWDPATNRFLHREGQQSIFTLGCRKSTPELDVSRYNHFGHHIQYLLQCFDKTPRTWKQLALDRRNKLEWSAFWVTAMVAVLTLVSIPCNIIQATYSVKAYKVALAQGAGQSRAS